jgi:hypothetical protein
MDTSDIATGAVLYQEQEMGAYHPIGYSSKSYNKAERNYTTYDKEVLVIMRALEEWRSLLIGTTQPFEIHTDHQNLTYFREPQKLTSRQVNWMTKLQDYDFMIKHVAGASNILADALSRPDGEEKAPHTTDVLLPDCFFSRYLSGMTSKEDEDREKRGKIISESHDTPAAGHPGFKRTLALVTRQGHKWKGIWRDVQDYVKGCQICQKNKPRIGPGYREMHPHEIAESPWEIMSWDMIGPLPESQPYNAIVTMVDTKMKAIKLELADITITVKGAAIIMKNQIFREEGLPRKIISNWGPQFVSGFMRELYQLLGIEGNPSTAYHPQMDGQTERVNREVEKFLRMFTNHQ